MSSPATTRRRPILPRALVGALALGTALTLGPLWTPAAQAHSELVSISPADGSTLDTAPSEVVLTFSDDVLGDFTQVELRDASGPLTLPAPVSKERAVTQALPAALPGGVYTVVFRIVSADSHPISGQSTFTVSSAATPAASPTPSTTPSTTTSPTSSTASKTLSPGPTTSARTATPTEQGGSGSPWLWVAVGLIVAAVAAAILLRRRRGSRDF